MGTDDRKADFEITYLENNCIKISTDGCSIVSEYIKDTDAKRTAMSPANVFFSAFAL